MKKILTLLLTVCCCVGAMAADIPNNEIWYEASEKLSETTSSSSSGLHTNAFNTSILSHTFSNGKGVIKFNGNVTSIGDKAFYYCDGMTSIEIPNSVTSIGEYAFRDCSGLKSINIPNSVTSIGNSAFYGCSSLTSVTIPNSVKSIGSSAFYGCSSLTSIEIPNSVTSIGSNAFDYCFGLISVTIPNSVTSIGHDAFSHCSGLTSIEIPNSVTSIGSYAFDGCSGLTSIKVDEDNTRYDSRNNCNAIIGTASNTLICGCKNTIIPNSVTSIGAGAFYGCFGLISVTIPNSVTSIGHDAFCGCSGLTSVEIPNSVTSIGYDAFYGCSGLTDINVTIESWSVNNILCSALGGTSYKWHYWCDGAEIKGDFAIPDTVTSIGGYTFYECKDLTSVTIPNSVTNLGGKVFSGCSGLTSIYVNWSRPLSIASDVFENIDFKTCTLYVPEGTATMYMVAPVWIDFVNIVEFSSEESQYEKELKQCDVNGDGKVNATDVMMIYNFILKY